MRQSIALGLLLSLGAFAGVASAQEFDSQGEAAMVERINALRAESQLAPLVRLDALDAVARSHSAEMASSGQLAHVSSSTGTPEDRVRGAGLAASRIAENVANHSDSLLAHQALVASAPHRANILDPNVTHVGIGSAQSARGAYVTQVFAGGLPAAEPAAPVAPSPTLAQEDESRFALIPPFIERAVEELAAPVISQLGQMPAAASALAGEAAPDAATEVAPLISAPLLSPGTDAITEAPSANAPVANLTPGAASALRELVGLGLSILGGSTR